MKHWTIDIGSNAYQSRRTFMCDARQCLCFRLCSYAAVERIHKKWIGRKTITARSTNRSRLLGRQTKRSTLSLRYKNVFFFVVIEAFQSSSGISLVIVIILHRCIFRLNVVVQFIRSHTIHENGWCRRRRCRFYSLVLVWTVTVWIRTSKSHEFVLFCYIACSSYSLILTLCATEFWKM